MATRHSSERYGCSRAAITRGGRSGARGRESLSRESGGVAHHASRMVLPQQNRAGSRVRSTRYYEYEGGVDGTGGGRTSTTYIQKIQEKSAA